MSSCIEILDLEQNTPEWIKFRQNHIGASDAPIILEKSPWTTPYQLWQMKLGLRPSPEENDAMRRGKQKEEIARNFFIKETGIFVAPAVIKNPLTLSFMCASLDGLSSCHKYALEIKVPGKLDHEAALDGVIPEKYIPQLIHQMIVCDIEKIFYYSWNETSSKIIEFHRDSNLEKQLLDKEKAFWECIENFKEPAFTERDFVNMSNNPDWIVYSNSLKEASNRRKQAERQEEEYRKKLIELADNQCCQGNNIRLTKYVRKGNIDTKKIVIDYNIDEERYRKEPIVGWRVS